MNSRTPLALAVCLCLFSIGPVAARSPAPDDGSHTPVTATTRHEVLATLATKLQSNYVFPDVAKRLAADILAKEARGGYDKDNDVEHFVDALSIDLRTLGKDAHFNAGYSPEDFDHMPPNRDGPPSAEEAKQLGEQMAFMGYGVGRVERLEGNVGYLEVRGFGPPDFVGAAFTSAMKLLEGTDALILDLRRNGGGQPAGVANLLSHLFADGDRRHLNDLYFRPKDTTEQYWTDGGVQPRYTKPIYVLTSGRTFSGGEECAYDLQTQKRATLVGEVTGGGANPGDMVSLGHGFGVFIPTGRAINPITHTNWEHVGVKPDIAVPAAQAEFVALRRILTDQLAKTTDPDRREELQDALKQAQKGQFDPPDYRRRR